MINRTIVAYFSAFVYILSVLLRVFYPHVSQINCTYQNDQQNYNHRKKPVFEIVLMHIVLIISQN